MKCITRERVYAANHLQSVRLIGEYPNGKTRPLIQGKARLVIDGDGYKVILESGEVIAIGQSTNPFTVVEQLRRTDLTFEPSDLVIEQDDSSITFERYQSQFKDVDRSRTNHRQFFAWLVQGEPDENGITPSGVGIFEKGIDGSTVRFWSVYIAEGISTRKVVGFVADLVDETLGGEDVAIVGIANSRPNKISTARFAERQVIHPRKNDRMRQAEALALDALRRKTDIYEEL